jgi:hypothetical protein
MKRRMRTGLSSLNSRTMTARFFGMGPNVGTDRVGASTVPGGRGID